MRKIIHIDMDAFFASIEQRDNEAYRGKPLAVGYAGNRGVVAAASYEARRYGVFSAMSSKVALRKCPHLIFVPSLFDVYESVSREIMEIFLEYTDLVEPLSLDEAFLDVTVNFKNIRSATHIAQEIKQRIFEKTHLTASAGVSSNKFLAKIASDVNKPNGLFVIPPKGIEKFVEQLEIEKFFGVGKVTARRMHQLGIKTGWDLKQHSEQELATIFGKAGLLYYQYARGVDHRPVEPDRIRKSVSAENTFLHDIDEEDALLAELEEITREVVSRIKESEFDGRTITLKLRYADFTTLSRSKTFAHAVYDFDTLYSVGKELLQTIDLSPKVRLLGLGVKNNESTIWCDAIQLSLEFKKHDDE